jgi:hypothetical protein
MSTPSRCILGIQDRQDYAKASEQTVIRAAGQIQKLIALADDGMPVEAMDLKPVAAILRKALVYLYCVNGYASTLEDPAPEKAEATQ